jgi:hypothetical protein
MRPDHFNHDLEVKLGALPQFQPQGRGLRPTAAPGSSPPKIDAMRVSPLKRYERPRRQASLDDGVALRRAEQRMRRTYP